MKKEIIRRGLMGIPLGLAIGTFITIVISMIVGDGAYHAVSPKLITDTGSELNAVILQAVLSMIYGGVFGAASVIWDTDWSILRMTVTHFLISSIATFPVAYYNRWMDRSLTGVLSYYGIFIAFYAVIWVIIFFTTKKNISELNRKIRSID